MIAKKIIVTGRVQGVGFRYYTSKKAMQLGVNGTVQNQEDGSVLIYAEANETLMDNFLSWCKKGPVTAFVSQCLIEDCSTNGFTTFTIIR